MIDPNALIAASQEVTRAYNAVFWGRYLSDQLVAEAEERLQQALDNIVHVVKPSP